MREIKFRIWDKKNKVYFYTYPVTAIRLKPQNQNRYLDGRSFPALCGGVESWCGSEYPEFDYSTQTSLEYVWEQYTGLKDKNGKEIYEGDIVHVGEFNMSGEVKFYACAFFIDFPDQTDSGPIGFLQRNGLKVIGNIHENKDLL